MKKKPIYLWVLLILSALISAMSLFGILSPLPSKETVRASQPHVEGLSAQQLLLSTSDSIEDICYAVGYSNVGYFYKVFRKLCGKSPKAYRKQVETIL